MLWANCAECLCCIQHRQMLRRTKVHDRCILHTEIPNCRSLVTPNEHVGEKQISYKVLAEVFSSSIFEIVFHFHNLGREGYKREISTWQNNSDFNGKKRQWCVHEGGVGRFARRQHSIFSHFHFYFMPFLLGGRG